MGGVRATVVYLEGFVVFWKLLKFWFTVESPGIHSPVYIGIYIYASLKQQIILCMAAEYTWRVNGCSTRC